MYYTVALSLEHHPLPLIMEHQWNHLTHHLRTSLHFTLNTRTAEEIISISFVPSPHSCYYMGLFRITRNSTSRKAFTILLALDSKKSMPEQLSYSEWHRAGGEWGGA